MKHILLFLSALLLSSTVWAQQGTLEYKTTMLNGNQTVESTSKMYYANGNVRTEVNVAIPGMGKPMKQTMLMLAAKPKTMFMLNEMNRTYMETTIREPEKASNAKITVNIVGKEKIKNLSCTHAEVMFEKGIMDVWTTKDIPGYAGMQSLIRSNRSMGNDNLYTELKKKGIDGIFVRMGSNAGAGQMLMELERFDTKPVAASLFQIPADYKKVDSEASRMLNMSPSDRKKFIEEMQKRQKSRQ